MNTKRKSLRHREHMARMKHRVEGGYVHGVRTKEQSEPIRHNMPTSAPAPAFDEVEKALARWRAEEGEVNP